MTAPRSELDVILEHATKDEESLSIALKIGAAYERLLIRIILDFLAALEGNLAARLPGWKVKVCRSESNIAVDDFVVAEFKGHPGRIQIVLTADEEKLPKWLYFSVRTSSDASLNKVVFASIQEHYTTGKPGSTSIWWQYVAKAYSGWGTEEASLLLYRKTDALEYFAGNLEQLARAVELALRPVAIP